ncbi:unnamed protein product [Colias eurytheme]|nr:unnamed protein product [Colias eurytheme]
MMRIRILRRTPYRRKLQFSQFLMTCGEELVQHASLDDAGPSRGPHHTGMTSRLTGRHFMERIPATGSKTKVARVCKVCADTTKKETGDISDDNILNILGDGNDSDIEDLLEENFLQELEDQKELAEAQPRSKYFDSASEYSHTTKQPVRTFTQPNGRGQTRSRIWRQKSYADKPHDFPLLQLYSDDEDVGCTNQAQDTRYVRLGADVISQNQREYVPLDLSDGNEDESEDEERLPIDFEPVLEEPGADMDIEEEESTSNGETFDYLTPKQNIKWRHRKIENTIWTDFSPPIAVDPIVQSPLDYYHKGKNIYNNTALFVVTEIMTTGDGEEAPASRRCLIPPVRASSSSSAVRARPLRDDDIAQILNNYGKLLNKITNTAEASRNARIRFWSEINLAEMKN